MVGSCVLFVTGSIVAAAGQQMSGFYIAGFVVSGLVLGFALLNLKKGTV
jgi:hypothetical protein